MRLWPGFFCAASVLCAASAGHALNNTTKGAVAGALGGAVVAGPVGLVVGGAGGALIGHDWAHRPRFAIHHRASYRHVHHKVTATPA